MYGPKMVSEYLEKHNIIYPNHPTITKITQEFPGDQDQGTPMVMEENDRFTIIGIFLRQGKKAAVYSQINVESRLWIQAWQLKIILIVCIADLSCKSVSHIVENIR